MQSARMCALQIENDGDAEDSEIAYVSNNNCIVVVAVVINIVS